MPIVRSSAAGGCQASTARCSFRAGTSRLRAPRLVRPLDFSWAIALAGANGLELGLRGVGALPKAFAGADAGELERSAFAGDAALETAAFNASSALGAVVPAVAWVVSWFAAGLRCGSTAFPRVLARADPPTSLAGISKFRALNVWGELVAYFPPLPAGHFASGSAGIVGALGAGAFGSGAFGSGTISEACGSDAFGSGGAGLAQAEFLGGGAGSTARGTLELESFNFCFPLGAGNAGSSLSFAGAAGSLDLAAAAT
mmetsp:Transcript_97101/g.259426  ORF Transcript_97101/g.259426 Transcript_97101/m.259426 type:complete len:257 (-) Transcript_97101:991-1761(-)